MDVTNFDDLLYYLRDGESDQIEAKCSANSIGKSALETISAFSNEPGLDGGVLIFGVEEQNEGTRNFVITGVDDPEKTQNELACLCRSAFNHEIRPKIKVISKDKRSVVLVYVPEAYSHEKPIYIKAKGIDKGAFRRIGASDQLCTQRDLDYLYQIRSQQGLEEKIFDYSSWEDIDPTAINEYRRIRKEIKPSAPELELNNEDLLIALHSAVRKGNQVLPTASGILLFGKTLSLQRLFPLTSRIDYILVTGTQWLPNPEHRYHAIEFTEPLVKAFNRIWSDVLTDVPKTFSLNKDTGRRVDILAIPMNVIREGIANLLMHRDYTSGSPSQIIRYANRLEFRNPGYSLKEAELLNIPGSEPRNPKIARVFQDLNFAETKGTGISAMRKMMREANLSVPLVESSRGSNRFVLTLLSHHLFNESDLEWLSNFKEHYLTDDEAKALIITREMGAITNADYRTISGVDTLSASVSLRKLRDIGLFEQKGSSSKTYYIPTEKLLCQGLTPDIRSGTPDIKAITPDIRSGTPDIRIPLDKILTDDLKQKIQSLTKRTQKEKIKKIIIEICSIQPTRANDLALLLDRGAEHLRNRYLSDMIKSGDLEYLYPENQAHPLQAYTARKIMK